MSRVIGYRKKIISLEIDIVPYSAAIENIILLGLNKRHSYVCFANVHMAVEANERIGFSQQVNGASLVLADGMPIVTALKLLYNQSQERIAGMDIFPDLLKRASERGLKVFFFGTSDEILTRISRRAKLEYPNLIITGLFSPPFDKPINDPSYIELINNSKANLVFVALGCPKQEVWMAENSPKINALLLGVGGAFPIYAEVLKRAPKFLRDMSLEWLYRLFQEPSRLFIRYFRTNSLFILFILKERIRLFF